MEAKELMIGDIIRVVVETTDDDDNEVVYKVPARVEAIDENEMLGEDGKCSILVEYLVANEMDCYENFDDIEPIPLTEELLLKNGFILDEEWDEYRIDLTKTYFSLEYTVRKESYYITISTYSVPIYIKYVHQLQHLLRVCGLSDMADKLKIE